MNDPALFTSPHHKPLGQLNVQYKLPLKTFIAQSLEPCAAQFGHHSTPCVLLSGTPRPNRSLNTKPKPAEAKQRHLSQHKGVVGPPSLSFMMCQGVQFQYYCPCPSGLCGRNRRISEHGISGHILRDEEADWGWTYCSLWRDGASAKVVNDPRIKPDFCPDWTLEDAFIEMKLCRACAVLCS